jgi:hypothetical protein
MRRLQKLPESGGCGTEHKEITVNLLRDNEKVNSVTLANGTTNYEFKDLDKYATDGHIYNYKVEEENVSGLQ